MFHGSARRGAARGDWPRMTREWVRRGEQVAVALIAAGILCMVQPFVLALLAYGFVLVLAGMIMFMVVSHL